MATIKYLDVTESYVDQIVKLQKAESAFFLQPIEKFLNNESKLECIHLLFSPDFGDKTYELYFDLVDAKYEIT